MPSDARAWLEGHEPERLRRGGVQHLPGVDVQLVAEHRELVHERDVHMPEGVLEELRGLPDARRRDRHDLVDELLVERDRDLERGPGRAADDLRRVPQPEFLIPGIDPLR